MEKATAKLFTAFLTVVFLTSAVAAQDDTAKFRFRASRAIPAGTVLHYVKTNIDGSQPEQIAQFVASPNMLEAFKYHPKAPPAGHVIADMDWRTFSAKRLTSWRVLGKDERKLFGTIDFDGKTKRATVSIPSAKSEAETFAFGRLPVHLYNFDLGSLNFAFPHVTNPAGSFVIGITDPTFRENAPFVEYKGAATVAYQADETRNKVPTRKYRIDGPGLQNRGGFIWVNKQHGWIEDIEIDLPDNPEWKTFKLKLQRVEKMTRAEWDRFIAAQL
jgi:hypothetical protein